MAFLLSGSITWQGDVQGNRDFDQLKMLKTSMTPIKLCGERARSLLPFATEAFSYAFEEKPDYTKLKFLLIQILLERDEAPDIKMDWSKHQ